MVLKNNCMSRVIVFKSSSFSTAYETSRKAANKADMDRCRTTEKKTESAVCRETDQSKSKIKYLYDL